jgi:hypothetical protein
MIENAHDNNNKIVSNFFCQVQEKNLKDISFFFLSIGGLEGLN